MRGSSIALGVAGGVVAIVGVAVAVCLSFLERHVFTMQTNADGAAFREIEAVWRWYSGLAQLAPALVLGGLLVTVIGLALRALGRPQPRAGRSSATPARNGGTRSSVGA